MATTKTLSLEKTSWSFKLSVPMYLRKALFDAKLNESKQLPGASDTAASFEILYEDHTLGNSLRYMIMKK